MTDIARSIESVEQLAAPKRASRSRGVWAYIALSGLSVACAGKHKTEAEAPERDEKSYYDDGASRPSHSEKSSEGSSGSMTKISDNPAEPVFTEGMSVDEAIRAVPPGIERRNIDQETLGKPLQELSLESCKAGSARIKVKVAVWNGKAVGIDVIPKSGNLATCIKGKISEITWEKKVKSLNTIEYQF